ncbi:hypothetical protein COT48_06265 [Candidatus Woesearchaeota archaeon CG08_land_8_20_14_0_20_47_9]|nr:MAG: hypothetical protein AUJ69_00995 [Candidatus Woesearchaeota archaeon CG1_02_47_18]PIO03080.1 MAG: hypothetical protein COT48_06265 [Candidatus Woesearchaeota archaeon CG08_land_8_20_14_0_20_47_9]HII29816.1 hypothetical protein [Candidatus Woesearchaeota archaeon]
MSTFGEVIVFFGELGVYDVILPFLLVFTIMFAVLDKTRVFGVEKYKNDAGDEVYAAKKQLNALVAFVIGFFVVASSQLVEIITEVSSNVVILALLGVFFMMLVGVFYDYEQLMKGLGLGKSKGSWQMYFFTFIMLIGVIFIFLHAIKTADGTTWLQIFLDWVKSIATNTAAASVVLFLIFIGVLILIVSSGKEGRVINQGEESGGRPRTGGGGPSTTGNP